MNRKLTQPEITAAIEPVTPTLPPILTPQEAADLLRLKLSTLYRHACEGRYASGAVKRGQVATILGVTD